MRNARRCLSVCGPLLLAVTLLTAISGRASEPSVLIVKRQAVAAADTKTQPETLDFRFRPQRSQACIGLVDDPYKTILGGDGGLYYDYGRSKAKGYSCGQGCFGTRFLAEVDVAGPRGPVRQSLLGPRVPIVTTSFKQGPFELRHEAWAGDSSSSAGADRFAGRTDYLHLKVVNVSRSPAGGKLLLQADAVEAMSLDANRLRLISQRDPAQSCVRFSRPCLPIESPQTRPVLRAVEPPGVTRKWAKPDRPCDKVFENVLVGSRGPLAFEFAAEKGRKYKVFFGLIEGWHASAGNRPLEIRVEGQAVRGVDMAGEFGRNVPAVFAFAAEDRNGDGLIDLAVHAASGARDRNTVLSALWIFDAADAPDEALLLADKDKGRPLALVDAQHIPESPRPLTLAWDVGSLAPAQEFELLVAVPQGPEARRASAMPEAEAERTKAIAYWSKVPLPYDRIKVADPAVQALLDSCIRNIYQAREIKNGLPAFQVGPTAYRGLWVVDGAFLLEAVSLLGRVDEARQGIDYLMSFQRPDGGFMLLDKHWKETGIVIWAVTRHARLTGDRTWLAAMWPKLQRGLQFIRQLRKEASSDPTSPSFGLLPPGASDGGLGGVNHEYTNVYWTMIGLKAGAEAAAWLGNRAEADAWQAEYDSLATAFRKAAQRDMRDDRRGNRALPIAMNAKADLPLQKAQWAFLHAVHPGNLFAPDDPLLRGNMGLLRACQYEGLVRDTGWLADGLWTYFGSFYGHAWLWLGDGRKAAETLYAFGNHASALLCWREEQPPAGEKPAYVGDMPHNWASAEFVRLACHLLILERGNELHLLEGLPRNWTRPGAQNCLQEVPTVFGPANLEMRVAEDGRSARLTLTPPRRAAPARIVVHLEHFDRAIQSVAANGRPMGDGPIPLPATGPVTIDLGLKP